MDRNAINILFGDPMLKKHKFQSLLIAVTMATPSLFTADYITSWTEGFKQLELISAIEIHDMRTFESLLAEKNPSIVNSVELEGQHCITPLSMAITGASFLGESFTRSSPRPAQALSAERDINKAFIRKLVLYGSDIHFKNQRGNNSLQMAVSRLDNSVDLAKTLLDAVEEQNKRICTSILCGALYWPENLAEIVTRKRYAQELSTLLANRSADGLTAIEQARAHWTNSPAKVALKTELIEYLETAQRFSEQYK